jgi:hypothetical protein
MCLMFTGDAAAAAGVSLSRFQSLAASELSCVPRQFLGLPAEAIRR